MESLKKLFECNICNGDILNPNQIQCGHILCNCCIKKWLEKKKSGAQCPECQVKINRRALKSREDITDLMSKFMKLKELFEKEAYESQIISNSESPEKVDDSRENKRPRLNSKKSTTLPRLILQSSSSKRSSKSKVSSPESKRQKVEESPPVVSQTYSPIKSTRRDSNSRKIFSKTSIISNLSKLDEKEEEIDQVEESVFDEEEEIFIEKDPQKQNSNPSQLEFKDRNVIDNMDMDIEFVPLKGSEDQTISGGKSTSNRMKYPRPPPSQKDIFAMTEMNEESDDEEKLRDIEKEVIEEDHLFLDKSIAEAETQLSDAGVLSCLDNESIVIDENNSKDLGNKLKEKQDENESLENIEIDAEKSNVNYVEDDVIKDKENQLMIINPVEMEVKEPLDLSIPKKCVSKLANRKIKYALRFVKPLDLSSGSKFDYTPKSKGSSSATTSATTSCINGEKASSEAESSENFYTPNYLAYLAEAEQDNVLKTPSLSRLRNTSLFREISGVNGSSQKKSVSSSVASEDIVSKYYKDDESLMSQKLSQENGQEILRKDSQDQNSLSQKISQQINHSSRSPSSNSNGKERVNGSPVSIASKTSSQEKVIESVIESSSSDNEEIDIKKSNISHNTSKSLNTSKTCTKFNLLIEDSYDENMGAMSESLFGAKPKSPPPIEKRNFVFCTTRLSSNQTSQLKELCNIYGGKISTNFTNEVTHLIVNLENDRVSRTLKYFHAIGGGKWVVVFDWVQESLRAKNLLPEDQFEVDIANFQFCDPGPRKSRLCSKRNLFDKVNFYFGDQPTQMPLEDCKQILEQLGAKVLDTYSKDSKESIIFIGDKENRKMNYMELFRSKCWITVTQEWILECISSYDLIPLTEDYLVGNIGYRGLIHALLPKTLQKLKETFVQANQGHTQYTCS